MDMHVFNNVWLLCMIYIYVCVCVCVGIVMCICLCGSHFPALRGSPWITVGECERTHALHGEMLYPTTPSAAPDASARASVGAPQIGSRLVLHLLVWWHLCNNVEVIKCVGVIL